MPYPNRIAATLALACATVAIVAVAATGRFDPSAYPNGGFDPVQDKTYASECGSCHFAYLPGLLPARSWQAIISNADRHFGESLSLAPDTAKQLQEYLTANAADHSNRLGSELMIERLRASATPTRITDLPLFKQRHFSVLFTLKAVPKMDTVSPLPPSAIKVVLNCNDCHQRAASGSFAEKEIVVKGLTKVVRPGGYF